MILDHLVLVYGGPEWWRLSLTRLALPLFMITAGILWRPGFRRRHAELIGAAAVSWPITAGLGIASPNILVLYVGLLPLLPWVARGPLLALALGVLQATYWPLPWDAYQPGYVLAWLAVGLMLRDRIPDELYRWGEWAAPFRGLGRWPLLLYVGHLVVLGVLVQ